MRKSAYDRWGEHVNLLEAANNATKPTRPPKAKPDIEGPKLNGG